MEETAEIIFGIQTFTEREGTEIKLMAMVRIKGQWMEREEWRLKIRRHSRY
jgi:hypothetical protein